MILREGNKILVYSRLLQEKGTTMKKIQREKVKNLNGLRAGWMNRGK